MSVVSNIKLFVLASLCGLLGCNATPNPTTIFVDGGVIYTGGETVYVDGGTVVVAPTGQLGVLSGYSHRRKLKVSNDAILESLVGVVVPVLIDEPDIFDHCRVDGLDLAVTLSDGTTVLNREIAYFDKEKKEAMLWVLVPGLIKGVEQTFYLYYGNPNITTYADKPEVWDNSYAAVWHLDETSDPIRDSTWNRNDAITENIAGTASSTLGAEGKVGRAVAFSSEVDNRVLISRNDPSLFTDYVTVTAWVNWRDEMATGTGRVFDRTREDNGFVSIYSLMVDNATGRPSAELFTADRSFSTLTSSITLTSGVWHHLAFVYGPQASALYVDGDIVATSTLTAGEALSVSSPGRSVMAIGNQGGRNRPLSGTVDEVKIVKKAKSSAWVKFRAEVEKDPKILVQTSTAVEEFCPSPYRYFSDDRSQCEWSCGEGTIPDEMAGACVCQEGFQSDGVDSYGRLVCEEVTSECTSGATYEATIDGVVYSYYYNTGVDMFGYDNSSCELRKDGVRSLFFYGYEFYQNCGRTSVLADNYGTLIYPCDESYLYLRIDQYNGTMTVTDSCTSWNGEGYSSTLTGALTCGE